MTDVAHCAGSCDVLTQVASAAPWKSGPDVLVPPPLGGRVNRNNVSDSDVPSNSPTPLLLSMCQPLSWNYHTNLVPAGFVVNRDSRILETMLEEAMPDHYED